MFHRGRPRALLAHESSHSHFLCGWVCGVGSYGLEACVIGLDPNIALLVGDFATPVCAGTSGAEPFGRTKSILQRHVSTSKQATISHSDWYILAGKDSATTLCE